MFMALPASAAAESKSVTVDNPTTSPVPTTVVNPTTSPVPTTDVREPALQPFQATLFPHSSSSNQANRHLHGASRQALGHRVLQLASTGSIGWLCRHDALDDRRRRNGSVHRLHRRQHH